MKRKNFSGIFSAVFAVATVITLASCSQDDEYYEDGLFTRADEMMTRGGEQGGYTPTPTPIASDTIERSYTFVFRPIDPVYKDSLPTFDVSIDVMTYRIGGIIAVEMKEYAIPTIPSSPSNISLLDVSFTVSGVSFKQDPLMSNRYKMCASESILRWNEHWNDNEDENGNENWSQDSFLYQGEVPYTIFY